jgi:hypothetical protein
LLLEPQDYFGAWIANQKGNCNPHDFYPTPLHVVELMAQMNFAGMDWREARTKTVLANSNVYAPQQTSDFIN